MIKEHEDFSCKKIFNVEEATCQTCKDNLTCYEDLISIFSSNCDILKENYEEGFSCIGYTENGCPYSLRQFCQKLKEIYRKKKDICENFSAPKTNPIEKCIICEQSSFQDCDKSESFLKNIKLSSYEIDTIINNQIHELRIEEGRCFEQFAFENTCWSDCDYTRRCLKGSNIMPDGECKFFPKNSTSLEEIDEPYSDECDLCKFFKICKSIISDRITAYKAEKEKKKMFQNFFSIGEIRNQFIEEE